MVVRSPPPTLAMDAPAATRALVPSGLRPRRLARHRGRRDGRSRARGAVRRLGGAPRARVRAMPRDDGEGHLVAPAAVPGVRPVLPVPRRARATRFGHGPIACAAERLPATRARPSASTRSASASSPRARTSAATPRRRRAPNPPTHSTRVSAAPPASPRSTACARARTTGGRRAATRRRRRRAPPPDPRARGRGRDERPRSTRRRRRPRRLRAPVTPRRGARLDRGLRRRERAPAREGGAKRVRRHGRAGVRLADRRRRSRLRRLRLRRLRRRRAACAARGCTTSRAR